MSVYKDLLRSKGLRVTSARIAVLQVLELTKHPIDISELIKCVERKKILVDQATIYRIIEHFIQKKLVKRIQFSEKKSYYEAKLYDHHHAICEKCHKVEDILRCSIDRIEREIEKNIGFRVSSHSLEYFGVCKNCQTQPLA